MKEKVLSVLNEMSSLDKILTPVEGLESLFEKASKEPKDIHEDRQMRAKKLRRKGVVNVLASVFNQEKYEWEELLDTAEVEDNNLHKIETFSDKLESIQKEMIDVSSIIALCKVIFKAIKNRLVLVLNLEEAPSLINNCLDCYFQDVNCRMSNNAIRAKLEDVRRIVTDEEVNKAIKQQGFSDMCLLTDESAVSDYVEVYQRVLRQMLDVRYERFDEYLDIIHNEEDLFEEQILSNDRDIEIVNYVDIPEDEGCNDYLD